MEQVKLLKGDNIELLKKLENNSVDSVITDPPYGLSAPKNSGKTSKGGFMNKKWDYDVPSVELWKEVLRVLKPGGHVLSFGGTRTYHRMVVNMEDAGFEIRDSISYMYGSGFSKSHNIGKAVDKRGGESIGWFGEWLVKWRKENNIPQSKIAELFPSKTGGLTGCVSNWELGNNLPTNEQFNLICETFNLPFKSLEEAEREFIGTKTSGIGKAFTKDGWGSGHDEVEITKGQSEWEGWGTALKPSMELICLARKPLTEKSIAENVLKHGTGGINIDACRVGEKTYTDDEWKKLYGTNRKESDVNVGNEIKNINYDKLPNAPEGRFPANTILECICDEVIPGEIWKKVVGYENYSVSNLGNVKNTNGDLAKLQETNKGYLSISLYKDGKYNNKLVHRLVGEAFIENPENKQTINHIDGNKTNNSVDNLEWATYKENNTHAIQNGLKTTSNNKPVGQYDLEGNLLNEYSSATEASKETGITRSKITDVCLGTQIKSKTNDKTYTAKTAGGYVWKHLPECPCYILDKQSGVSKSSGGSGEKSLGTLGKNGIYNSGWGKDENAAGLGGYGDKGGASRFFYTAKVSKKERNMGLDEFEEKEVSVARANRPPKEESYDVKRTQISKNHHPTVKPINLMTYLCRLITPKGGVVLDMYMGSGSTGISALLEGFNFIGMEMDEEYFNIAEARINNYEEYRQFIKK